MFSQSSEGRVNRNGDDRGCGSISNERQEQPPCGNRWNHGSLFQLVVKRPTSDQGGLWGRDCQRADEGAARDFVREVRWRHGVVRLECRGLDVWRQEPKSEWLRRTPWCRKRFSVGSGMLKERSRIPLRKWLITFFIIMTDHRWISGTRLTKFVDGSQKTAYILRT